MRLTAAGCQFPYLLAMDQGLQLADHYADERLHDSVRLWAKGLSCRANRYDA